ncbi:hypothetical protein TNCV_5073611 [Trichonephila clavipes]|nr:hypothetical protein TNCV_5073611 [Trichonephila clavipes]
MYSPQNWDLQTICELVTCADHRPCIGLNLPPYTIIIHSVKMRQSIEIVSETVNHAHLFILGYCLYEYWTTKKIYSILGFLLVLSSCKGHVGPQTILGNQKSSVLSHNAQNSNDCPSIIPKPMDCEEVRRNGFNTSGVYTIWPRNRIITKETARVYCDMTTNGGGWTVRT